MYPLTKFVVQKRALSSNLYTTFIWTMYNGKTNVVCSFNYRCFFN